MAEFVHFEAETDDEINISDDDETIDDNVSEKSFINDVEINDSRNFYRQFANVENDLDQVLSDVRNEALQDIDQFDEISNLNDDSENEWKLTILKDHKIMLKNLIKPCFQMKVKIKINFVKLYSSP